MIRRIKHMVYLKYHVEELRMEVLNLALMFPYSENSKWKLKLKARLLHKYEERLQCMSLI